MKKKIINGLLMAALVAGTTSSFVSCKDYNEDVKSELGGTIADLQKKLDDQDAALNALKVQFNQKISELESRLNKINSCDCPDNVESRLQDLEGKMRTVLANYITASALTPYAKLTDIPSVAEFVTDAKVKEYLLNYAKKSDIPTIPEIPDQPSVSGYVKSSELATLVANILAGYDYLTTADLQGYAKTDDLFDKTMLNKYLLRGDFDTEFDARLADQKQKLADLIDEVDDLKAMFENVLGSMVTGIIIQGTYNPVFGSLALPLDVRSNFFAAYYGKTSGKGVEFPTALPRYYVNADQALTEDELDAIGEIEGAFSRGSEARLFNESEGNAGLIYLTVNPSSVDFDAATGFKLVNSQDAESAFQVGALAKSDKELTMGWDITRASGAALYEAPITLKEQDIDNVKTVIDFAGLASEVKNVFKERSKGSVVELATKLYTEASGVQLPAYGVKYGWNDELGDHAVYSQFSLAATAVQPLSYNFLYDIDGKKVVAPLFERIESLLGSIIGQVKNAIPSNLNIDPSKLTFKVELSDADKAKLKMSVPVQQNVPVTGSFTGNTITIDPYNYSFTKSIAGETINININVPGKTITPTGNVNASANVDFTVDVDMTDTVEGLINSINNGLASSDLGGVLDAVKSLSKITTAFDGVQSRINSYIDRFHSIFGSLIENVNATLQPVLLINTTEGLRKVTNAEIGSPVVGTEATLVPTSYTAEMLAPAYKKLVAVTAITKNGVAVAKSDVQAFNQANGLNKVLDGSVNAVNVSGLQSGYVYEFVLTAVDYTGYVVAKKYYLNVQ